MIIVLQRVYGVQVTSRDSESLENLLPPLFEMEIAHYSPPWANTSIIGIAGGSGSGKTSLAIKIVTSLNLPWVVILSMVTTFYLLSILGIENPVDI